MVKACKEQLLVQKGGGSEVGEELTICFSSRTTGRECMGLDLGMRAVSKTTVLLTTYPSASFSRVTKFQFSTYTMVWLSINIHASNLVHI